MRKIKITVIVSLVILVFSFQTSQAADELIMCDPEPTVMTIDLGDIVECQITPASETDFFLFNGSIGELVVLKLLDLTSGCITFGASCPVAQLFDPNDPITPIATLGAGTDVEMIELMETGTYTIRVRENGNDQTESYRIALERLFPASPSALSIWPAETISDTISPAPDNDFFLFDLSQNDVISLTLLDLTSGCITFGASCPVAQLFDPSRNLILTLGPGIDSEIITLPETGTYTVHLAENGHDQSESYNLTLECLSGSCFPPPPIPTCNGLEADIIGTPGDNIIMGTENADVIVGFGGNDTIYGLGGDDVICGEDGDDIIYGGDGKDRLIGDDGNDVLIGGAGNDSLFGFLGNDSLIGERGRDVLRGGGGNDTLDGGPQIDRLFGGNGNDTLFGNNGDDFLFGEDGFDVCDGGTAVETLGDETDDPTTCEILVNIP